MALNWGSLKPQRCTNVVVMLLETLRLVLHIKSVGKTACPVLWFVGGEVIHSLDIYSVVDF